MKYAIDFLTTRTKIQTQIPEKNWKYKPKPRHFLGRYDYNRNIYIKYPFISKCTFYGILYILLYFLTDLWL